MHNATELHTLKRAEMVNFMYVLPKLRYVYKLTYELKKETTSKFTKVCIYIYHCNYEHGPNYMIFIKPA